MPPWMPVSSDGLPNLAREDFHTREGDAQKRQKLWTAACEGIPSRRESRKTREETERLCQPVLADTFSRSGCDVHAGWRWCGWGRWQSEKQAKWGLVTTQTSASSILVWSIWQPISGNKTVKTGGRKRRRIQNPSGGFPPWSCSLRGAPFVPDQGRGTTFRGYCLNRTCPDST